MLYEDHKFEGLIYDGGEAEDFTFAECEFHRCEFLDVSVKNCSFRNCLFRSCTIINNRFKYTDMLNNDFDRCNLTGIYWPELRKGKNMLLPFGSFKECRLHHNSFYLFQMKRQNFEDCDLTGTVFEQCNLQESRFGRANLTDVVFKNNNLTGADFRAATNYYFSPENNRMKNAKFSFPEAVRLLSAAGIIVE